MVTIDCMGKTIREINTKIKTLAQTEQELFDLILYSLLIIEDQYV